MFKPLLWSHDFNRLDPDRDRKTIIVNTLNYGTLAHWRWLIEYYGLDFIRDLLSKIPASELRPRARRLVGLLFSVSHFNHAPRSAH